MERYRVIDTSNYGDIFETNYNFFGQLTWLKNKWMVNFGLRFDAFKFEYVDKTSDVFKTFAKYQTRISPKLNIAYNAINNLQLYVKLGQGFHSNDTRVVTRYDSLSTLPKAYGGDFGMTYKPFPRFIFNIALWYLYLEEELVWSGDGGTWEPSGRTNRFGVDLSLRWQILKWLFFDGDINYCLARFIDEPEGENYVPLAPLFTSTGGLTLNHPAGWSGALRYRYISERPADEINNVSAIGYFITDLKVNYTWRSWTFGIAIENLFNSLWNEAQFAGDYRLTPSSEAEYGLTFTPGTPFFLRGGITVQF
jgi:outer membrane receptor protein involved in Fe transport